MNATDNLAAGTPRAAATCGSTETNISGRQMATSPTITTTAQRANNPSWTWSTATIWPVSRPNLFALRPS